MPIQQGLVKSCLSGDTLVLSALKNPKNERTLSLAFVTAPRMRREGDEAFAVESRDFIRKLVVGKVIQFSVLYSVPTGAKREYGTVTLQDGQQIPELCVAEGFLKLREDAGKREESEEATALVEKLRGLEARAKADGKGIWNAAAERIQTLYEIPDPPEFVKKWKGHKVEAIIEKVLSGDRLIARLMESPTRHYQTMILIAGIRAPSTKRPNASGGQEQPAEPFGDEAQEFVDSKLLQRGVTIVILGLSPQNQLIASVMHPNGDIAPFVLKAGLARCTDYHATLLGSEMQQLRQAEKHAKDNRLGIFKTAGTPTSSSAEADAVVSRVQTADTLYLRYPNGTERRVNLSSVRQPKPSDPKQAPFGAEAKEFMRKRLIGKHVKVSIDGKRPATEGYDEREMATVVQNKENVALGLVQNGYASVLRHRMDDTDRSPIYDDLLAAEDSAQKEQRGMWSLKPPEAKQYVDYSESLDKAKRLLSLLSRQKRVPATVDFVKGGSRFTLLIPRENAKLTFVLSGIQAPRSARNSSETSEPFGKEAHELANRRLQQRDVEIDVEDTDKVGGFIGKLYINRENFAKILLEEGYAAVRMYSAEKSGNAAELVAAETKAKEAQKGLWHDYEPSQEVDDAAADDHAGATPAQSNGAKAAANGDQSAGVQQDAPSKDYRDVCVTFVDPTTCRLKLQQISSSTTGALQTLMSAFRSFHISPAASTSAPSFSAKNPPKAGDLVAAKFSEDGEWYRARVRRNDRDAGTSEIVYVDYGNAESLPWTQLRSLGDASRFGAQALKPQALDAALSFVQFPLTSTEYVEDATRWLSQRTEYGGLQLVARVDYTDQKDSTLWITLFDPTATSSVGDGASSSAGAASAERGSVNAEIVEEGLGMVGRKLTRWERAQGTVLQGLKKKEAAAKEERRGMWEYGDLTED